MGIGSVAKFQARVAQAGRLCKRAKRVFAEFRAQAGRLCYTF
jgi:hypothetical protein